jgi:hypothetical protein
MAVNWKHVADTLALQGIDLNTQFDSLTGDQVKMVEDQAKKSGYRAPKNSSASPADMFFSAVQRKAGTRRHASINSRKAI